MRDFPALAMQWQDGLFAHWPVAPERVRPLVPDALDVEVREGTAWVSALPSVVAASRPAFVPSDLPASLGTTFPQVNFRTYVRHEGESGVYFLSLDTTTGLGVRVARALWGVPYYRADIDFERGVEPDGTEVPDGIETPDDGPWGDERTDAGPTFRFESRRLHTEDPPARFAAAYRPTGRPERADPDSLDAFLAERYRAFVVRGDRVWCVRIEHPPWPLCPAEATVHADSLFEAAGLLAPAEEPTVRYSPGVEMTVRTPFRP